MGIGNKIPGVSGGTVSFVLGFYGDLIYSLQKLNLKALKLLISFRFASFYRYIKLRTTNIEAPKKLVKKRRKKKG